MCKPDAGYHVPETWYVRSLVNETGLTQREIAERLGVSLRAVQSWLDDGPHGRPCPYTAQYALEMLAGDWDE